MENSQNYIQDYFRSLTIIYYALLGSLLCFGLVSFAVATPSDEPAMMQTFLIVTAVLLAGGIAGSSIYMRNRMQKILQQSSAQQKLEDYRSALIVKYALLEAPAFFAIISYILFADYLFLILAGIMLLYFATQKPSLSRIMTDTGIGEARFQPAE